MSRPQKLFEHILLRRSDANVPFEQLRALLGCLGFDERIKGDHHIFTRSRMEEILNLQPRGGKAKPYQVKQVRDVIVKYNLTLGD
ncbi:MAG: type II toxin-antitoxin system HicA family toxin [Planctomycetota bacterium]